MNRSDSGACPSSAAQVDSKIAEFDDWRGIALTRIRELIKAVEPDVEEVCKWFKPSNPTGVPVWSYAGIICTGESYKAKVKLTFAQGAFLPDPAGLFNASLEGRQRRAIDIHEGDEIDDDAFKALVAAAIAYNVSGTRKND
ncbi:DUF1801 domain-containing protein [Gynuella sunshinyii]|uniref:YdhG-like domain-containing protein n=1 Tax=Gynuella sunshinyii YC6258 TaxID=1445510 RepID=A0A0C5VTG3_9GAMM|nr:DUF1801 domain-containing protein [Gynuella sunshinyii]AJQ97977.1 hypothetical protein YC6258_05953 [Gynuella sunshinyii YC6258]